jgi:hypothetical protein
VDFAGCGIKRRGKLGIVCQGLERPPDERAHGFGKVGPCLKLALSSRWCRRGLERWLSQGAGSIP